MLLKKKRKRGRPLLSWRQCIKQDLKRFQLEHTLMTSTYYLDNAQIQLENNFVITDTKWKEEKKHKELQNIGKSILFLFNFYCYCSSYITNLIMRIEIGLMQCNVGGCAR